MPPLPVTYRQRKLIRVLKVQLAMDDDTFIAFVDEEVPDAELEFGEPVSRNEAAALITALQREQLRRKAGA